MVESSQLEKDNLLFAKKSLLWVYEDTYHKLDQ